MAALNYGELLTVGISIQGSPMNTNVCRTMAANHSFSLGSYNFNPGTTPNFQLLHGADPVQQPPGQVCPSMWDVTLFGGCTFLQHLLQIPQLQDLGVQDNYRQARPRLPITLNHAYIKQRQELSEPWPWHG